MEQSNEEKLTVEGYQKYGKEWAEHHSTKTDWEVKQEFSIFQKHLPSGKVIEIGCGYGRDAEKFVEQKYDYVGIDASQSMLELAKKKVPNGKFICCNMLNLDQIDEKNFDGFWAVASLLHIPKKTISIVLKKIYQKLNDNGIGFISIKKGDREFLDHEFRYEKDFPRFYALYQMNEFTNILEKNGFKILEQFEKQKGKNTWLCIFVQKK